MTTLTCPKCRADMHAYERNSVTVEQCLDCRGLFLDRGELERLIQAESAYYADAAMTQTSITPETGHGAPRSERRHVSQPSQRLESTEGYGDRPKRRKRGGFLEDLFDFG
jgi:uncharacterized protein